MAKDKKQLNPMDSFRKAEKKKLLKKHKKDRIKNRQLSYGEKDPIAIREQIQRLARQESAGQLDGPGRKKKEELQDMLKLVLKKQREMKAEDDEKLNSNMKKTAMTKKELKSLSKKLYRRPQDSVYYHPTLNPFGAPPPGKPQKYKVDLCEDDSDSDSEINSKLPASSSSPRASSVSNKFTSKPHPPPGIPPEFAKVFPAQPPIPTGQLPLRPPAPPPTRTVFHNSPPLPSDNSWNPLVASQNNVNELRFNNSSSFHAPPPPPCSPYGPPFVPPPPPPPLSHPNHHIFSPPMQNNIPTPPCGPPGFVSTPQQTFSSRPPHDVPSTLYPPGPPPHPSSHQMQHIPSHSHTLVPDKSQHLNQKRDNHKSPASDPLLQEHVFDLANKAAAEKSAKRKETKEKFDAERQLLKTGSIPGEIVQSTHTEAMGPELGAAMGPELGATMGPELGAAMGPEMGAAMGPETSGTICHKADEEQDAVSMSSSIGSNSFSRRKLPNNAVSKVEELNSEAKFQLRTMVPTSIRLGRGSSSTSKDVKNRAAFKPVPRPTLGFVCPSNTSIKSDINKPISSGKGNISGNYDSFMEEMKSLGAFE